MRAFLVPVIASLILAGSIVSYGEQDAKINLKQLVQNQISQIRARSVRQEVPAEVKNAPVEVKTAEVKTAEVKTAEEKTVLAETRSGSNNASLSGNKAPREEKVSSGNASSKSDDGLFLKLFILLDLALLSGLFVYWRRRKLKIGMAEKAKFKKNITKLRSEKRFYRRTKTGPDEVRKRLQADPLCEVEDEAMLRLHAKKLSVSQGELLLASRIRQLEKARE